MYAHVTACTLYYILIEILLCRKGGFVHPTPVGDLGNLDPELVEAAANVTRVEKRGRDTNAMFCSAHSLPTALLS